MLPFVDCPRHNKDHVVDHVAVRAQVQKRGEGLLRLQANSVVVLAGNYANLYHVDALLARHDCYRNLTGGIRTTTWASTPATQPVGF